MTFIKVCGVQSYDEACLAFGCGATALGFLVGLTHRAEDELTPVAARAIVGRLPTQADAVLVTHLIDPNQVTELATFVGAQTIQVHGDMSAAHLLHLRALAPQTRLLKAVHVSGEEALGLALAYATVADALVLDSRTVDRLGGTGLPHDWSVSQKIVAAVAPLPVYLAGGLQPDNVEQAISRVRPAGVDVNSGVEDANGRKDAVRVHEFVARARAALIQGRGAP